MCIRYSINFEKQSVSALFNLGSKVNAVHLTLAKKLGLPIKPTNVRAQKIHGSTLDTYGMVVAAFLIKDKADRVKFFKKTFLVANVSLEIVFRMPFFTISGANVDFLGHKLRWKTYTTKEALLTTRHIELVDKKEFAAIALDPKHEIYVVHIGSVSYDGPPNSSSLELDVYPSHKPQVFGLIAKKASTKVPAKYSDCADVFSLNLASELSKHTGINDNTIELVDGQQPPYRPIYNLGLEEL